MEKAIRQDCKGKNVSLAKETFVGVCKERPRRQ